MLEAVTIQAAGTTDCEVFHDGWLLQPVNAVSSLAFSVAGFAIIAWASRARGHERTLRIIFGIAMVATGLGSFVFHGFDSALAQFLHDITFLGTIWILAVINVSEVRGWSRSVGWGTVTLGVSLFTIVLLIGPHATNILTVGVTVTLVLADVSLRRGGARPSRWYWVALASMVLAVIAFSLGRSSGPLCDPDSVLQGHALWHVLSAAAITAYFVATSEARIDRKGSA